MPGAVQAGTDPALPSQSPQSHRKDGGQAEQGCGGEVEAPGGPEEGSDPAWVGGGDGIGRVGGDPNLCCAHRGALIIPI